MEALDYAALASFAVLALLWVALPLRSPVTVAPAATAEPAAIAA